VNARDAMPNGGSLTIETANVEIDEEDARLHPDASTGSFVALSVTDTGTGIDPTVCPRIFDPFFTTKAFGKGTGLGLSTVYGIVTQSGGWIEVDSEVGVGSTFTIYLPRVLDVTPDSDHATAVRKALRGLETILVVEDEEAVRGLAARTLRSAGYTVLEAGDGAEALRIHDSHTGRVDLVITDVIMPGINGRVLAGLLSERDASLKVLFMSGYTDDAIIHHGVLDDSVSFIGKPFSPDGLAQKAREVLDCR